MQQQEADRMLAELDEHGWAQFHRVDGDGKICVSEARYRARISSNAWVEMGAKASELFQDRIRVPNMLLFNDHQDTTEEDIRLVIKHCVEDS